MNYFITGSDTGVGKTYVTTLLIESLRKAGLDSVGMKPICCGERLDSLLLHRSSGGHVNLEDVNPVWLKTALSPYAASIAENAVIDLELIKRVFSKLRNSHPSILVEGVGGWLAPIRKDYFVSDLAVDFGLPVVVVAANRLGALNHTLLTIKNIQSRGLQCAGVILNNFGKKTEAASTNSSVFEAISEVPILFNIEKDQRFLEIGIV